jgi:cyclopropane fatty-acyl-phospholipid synthase-like methyltransferase
MNKPFSQACENNRAPILAVLRRHLADGWRVLEIGSGTGQHAVYFGAHLPAVAWQTSDRIEYHDGIRLWLTDALLANVALPLELDVLVQPWPVDRIDAVFSANTAHIMSWSAVEAMFRGVGRVLERRGLFLLYGPFSYGESHTSPSNAAFDASLRARDPEMGVRAFEAVDALAQAAGLQLLEDNAMPANNRLLVWRRAPDRQSS